MRLPTEIVKHVRDAAGVSVSVCDKSCRPFMDRLNLVFLVMLVWTPYCRTVVQVGSYHGEVSLCLDPLRLLVLDGVSRSLVYCRTFELSGLYDFSMIG